MQKVDKELQKIIALSSNDCVYECIVYYYNKRQLIKYFDLNNITIKLLNLSNISSSLLALQESVRDMSSDRFCHSCVSEHLWLTSTEFGILFSTFKRTEKKIK